MGKGRTKPAVMTIDRTGEDRPSLFVGWIDALPVPAALIRPMDRGNFSLHASNAAFDRLDANRDGAISRDEFAKGREVRIEKRIVRNDGAPGARPMGMRHGGGRGMGGGMMRMADSNNDGRVTLAEAEAAALRHFDMMDVNRDGRVTPEERQQMRMQRRAARANG